MNADATVSCKLLKIMVEQNDKENEEDVAKCFMEYRSVVFWLFKDTKKDVYNIMLPSSLICK